MTQNALSIALRQLARKRWMPRTYRRLLETAAHESEQDWDSIVSLAESKALAVRQQVATREWLDEVSAMITTVWDIKPEETHQDHIRAFLDHAIKTIYREKTFSSPYMPVPGGPKMLRETLARACAAIAERELDEESIAIDLELLSILIERLDQMRPLGVDGKHGNLHTQHCGCEDKDDMPAPTWHFTLLTDGTLVQHYVIPRDRKPEDFKPGIEVPEVEISERRLAEEIRIHRSARAYAAGPFATLRPPPYPQVGDRVVIHKPSSQAGLGSFYSTRDGAVSGRGEEPGE